MAVTERITARNAARQVFMGTLRELVRAYQAAMAYAAADLRERGLTAPQADVIFALGNTPGMTFKELGAQTLITKGTLTGVVDRLEAKGLVRRVASTRDRRKTLVVLTPKGERLFNEVFPRHVEHMKRRFDRLGRQELRQAEEMLRRIRSLF